jgi:hypothetical protein
MADFLGFKRLFSKFKKLHEEARRASLPVVTVGFTAAYALYVHEKVEMKLKGQPRPGKNRGRFWDPQGRAQAKFLEEPARQMSDSGELGRVVAEMYQQTGSLEQALLAAGLRLQRAAMLKVPVDTGNLKNSAFTRKE